MACHTCGSELPEHGGESPFCPHCGAPQLYLSMDYQSVETGGEPPAAPGGLASTGIVPPPRPQQVDWKIAIMCAAAVALVGGVLTLLALRVPVLTPASVLWVFSGALITISLYRRRRPMAWVDVGVGARIGVLAGLCMALGLAAPMALAGIVARFGLKAMGGFDAQLSTIFEMVIKQSQASTPFPPEAMQLIHSQEFRAGYVLFCFGLLSAFLLVLSMASGAFAGLLGTRRKAAV